MTIIQRSRSSEILRIGLKIALITAIAMVALLVIYGIPMITATSDAGSLQKTEPALRGSDN